MNMDERTKGIMGEVYGVVSRRFQSVFPFLENEKGSRRIQ